MKILKRYIIAEFIPPALLGLAVFTFILLMDKIVDLVDLVINKGVDFLSVCRLLIYSLPLLLSLSTPMAVLVGMLLSFGRLSQDKEITAMRSAGVSLYSIILAPITLAILVSIILVFFNENIAPIAQYKFRKFYFSLLYKNPIIKFEEHTFTDIGDYRIYVENIDRKETGLRGVIIYKDLHTLITAQRGNKIVRGGKLYLHLEDGSIHEKNKKNPQEYNQLNFNEYEIGLDMYASKEDRNRMLNKNIREMNQSELKTEIDRLRAKGIPAYSIRVEYHLRRSLAFAAIAFALIGIPLGIKAEQKGKTIGFGLSLGLIFIYYILLVGGITLGERGFFHPLLCIWIPNIFMVVFGSLLIYKAVNR